MPMEATTTVQNVAAGAPPAAVVVTTLAAGWDWGRMSYVLTCVWMMLLIAHFLWTKILRPRFEERKARKRRKRIKRLG